MYGGKINFPTVEEKRKGKYMWYPVCIKRELNPQQVKLSSCASVIIQLWQ